MRRVYYVDSKRKKLVSESMACYREARRNIDPALLQKMHDLISKKQGVIDLGPSPEPKAINGKVPVDRVKVLRTIQKFIEIQSSQSGKSQMMSRLMTIMAESLH